MSLKNYELQYILQPNAMWLHSQILQDLPHLKMRELKLFLTNHMMQWPIWFSPALSAPNMKFFP